jgi:hypothetical protein
MAAFECGCDRTHGTRKGYRPGGIGEHLNRPTTYVTGSDKTLLCSSEVKVHTTGVHGGFSLTYVYGEHRTWVSSDISAAYDSQVQQAA